LRKAAGERDDLETNFTGGASGGGRGTKVRGNRKLMDVCGEGGPSKKCKRRWK